MMRKLAFLWVFLLCACSSCSLFSDRKSPEKPVHNPFIEEGILVQRGLLKQGGPVLLVPFIPGENVAANEDVDRVSLRIIKGLAEVLKGSGLSLTPVYSQEASHRLIIKGRVQDIRRQKRWWTWGRRDQFFVQVIGQMVDSQSGGVVLSFRHQRLGRSPQDTIESLSQVIGEDLARYIIWGSQ